MKRFVGILLAVIAQSALAGPKPGDVAPVHVGTTLEGKPVLATEFPGKVIVVSYWATWCTFCVKELAMLDAIQTAASGRVQVISVNIESASVFRDVSERLNKFHVLLLYDPDRKGRNAYGVNGIPHMAIIGKDGRIDTINVGYSEEAPPHVVEAINRALGATPAAEASE